MAEKFVVGLLGGGFQVTNPNPSFLELRLVQLRVQILAEFDNMTVDIIKLKSTKK